MSTVGFVASHAAGAGFERGLRSFCGYRDPGIKQSTEGRVDAHVIRHRELGHSEDIEMLEIVLPGSFATEDVDKVQPRSAGAVIAGRVERASDH